MQRSSLPFSRLKQPDCPQGCFVGVPATHLKRSEPEHVQNWEPLNSELAQFQLIVGVAQLLPVQPKLHAHVPLLVLQPPLPEQALGQG